MFCSECGVKAQGKFCHQCGSAIAGSTAAKVVEQSPLASTVPWQDEVQYEVLIKTPHIRSALAQLAMQAEPGVSATDFLNLCDAAFKPFGPVSMTKVAPVLQSMYGKWGVKTGKQRQEALAFPVGVVLFRTLCSLARHGQKIKQVSQGEDGCILQVTLPSSVWTMEGQMLVTVSKQSASTSVEAVTKISGQWYDWGVSTKVLDQLFRELHQAELAEGQTGLRLAA